MMSGLPRCAPLGKIRGTAHAEDRNTGYTGNGPQVTAALWGIAISLLRLAGITAITRILQHITRDRIRAQPGPAVPPPVR
jgi:hypothetical protein